MRHYTAGLQSEISHTRSFVLAVGKSIMRYRTAHTEETAALLQIQVAVCCVEPRKTRLNATPLQKEGGSA
jgi:hypothetical protein